MNEATLEARLNEELKKLFPMLDSLNITHQKSFTIRLGHNIIVNGYEKANAGGRLDVLVSYKNKHLAIIELKSPDIELDSQDVEQGISYARLLTPMPPLVIISNGRDIKYYKSFDKQIWNPKNIDEEAIKSLFDYGLYCAEAEHDEAIKILIGQQPYIWKDILSNYTREILKEFEGDIGDFTSPIATEFIIEREETNHIYEKIMDNPLVTLIGAPLSGKTNIAYQICNLKKSNLVPVYINSTTNYGILQKIANKFSQNLFKQMSVENVRHWLINSFRNKTDDRLVIVIDNLSLSIGDNIWQEIYELIDININNEFCILLIMDEFCFKKISNVNGRPTRNCISKSCIEKIESVSDEEFENVQQEFLKKMKACFHKGAFYNLEYRNPRLLRLLAANVKKTGILSKDTDDTVVFMPSITTFDTLIEIWNNFVIDIEMQTDMRFLVKAFLEDESIRNSDAALSIMSFGRGAITLETAESILSNDRIKRLSNQGFIQRFNLNGGKAYVLPKFTEALSAAAAFYVAEKIEKLYKENKGQDAYKYLISVVPAFPYGELVGAMAIFEAYKKEPDILTFIINKLLEDEPQIEKIKLEGKYLAYFDDLGEVEIPGEEGTTFSNWYPWLILSHIASMPLGDDNGNRDIQLNIFSRVGSFEDILMRVDNIPFNKIKGYHVHNVENCNVICGKIGIIEPITLAMQRGFYEMPEEMIRLCNWAKEYGNHSLLMRLNNAAYSTHNCTDQIVKNCSDVAIELTSKVIKNYVLENIDDYID